jgi:phosphopantothenoylcysteine synthetase/decarboxylase
MRITLGVTGGVAAYKAAELVRRLQQEAFSRGVRIHHASHLCLAHRKKSDHWAFR